MNTSTMCEWDQFVELDPDMEQGKKPYKSVQKKIKYSSDFYYGSRQKYSEYNPLEALYEDDEDNEDDDDYIRKPKTVKREKNYGDLKINNYLFWGDVLVKSIFTGYLVYAFFLV
tara:strand:+ start:970 stop:1311 length:342 start_codon:yes stop_codon:yes gene_type:complete